MQRTARVPDDTKLVLPVRPGQVAREHALTITIFVLTAAIAGLGVGATGSLVWLVIGLLCLAGAVLEVLLVRAQAGFGPLLAADAEQVWVRAGGFLSPRSVRLAWPEVSAVTLHRWRGRRNASARYLSFDLTDEAMAALAAGPRLASRARRLTRVFGSPLAVAVAEQGSHVLDQMLRDLRDLAPDGVQFAEKN